MLSSYGNSHMCYQRFLRKEGVGSQSWAHPSGAELPRCLGRSGPKPPNSMIAQRGWISNPIGNQNRNSMGKSPVAVRLGQGGWCAFDFCLDCYRITHKPAHDWRKPNYLTAERNDARGPSYLKGGR